MLALVGQTASLVINNECEADASCPNCEEHKEHKEHKEHQKWSRNDLLKTPFAKHDSADKKGSSKREEIKKIIEDHKAKNKVLIEKGKSEGRKGKPYLKPGKKPFPLRGQKNLPTKPGKGGRP